MISYFTYTSFEHVNPGTGSLRGVAEKHSSIVSFLNFTPAIV